MADARKAPAGDDCTREAAEMATESACQEGTHVAVIDRDRERRLVESFVDASGSGARALLLHGEAGIGKTTIWQTALEGAHARGYRLLMARPTEAEASLPFAGLVDLLAGIVDEPGPALPAPQRRALDVALMRAGADEAAVQPLALSLAVVAILRDATAQGPILIAVDDLQWLDDATTGVVRYALRRLEREPVAVVATLRTTESLPTAALFADLSADRVRRLEVTGMPVEAVELLLEAQLALRLPSAALRHIHRLSGGNPLHALEVGRLLVARDGAGAALDGVSQLPPSLAALLRERLDALRPEAREVVTHAAALAHPTAALLAAALGAEAARVGLAEARAAGVVGTGDDPLRFSHPLLGEAAVAALDDLDRRELHRRMSAVVAEPEERARHLALAAADPDAEAAAALDLAAVRAHRRGAPEAAAELAELASRLTPAADPGWSARTASAGRYRLMAGEVERARELLERAIDDERAAEGADRAALLLELAVVRQLAGDLDAAEELGREALGHAGGEVALTIRIKLLLAGMSYLTGRRWADGARHAADALHLAEELGDPRTLATAIGRAATWRYATGSGVDASLRARIAELEPWTDHLRLLDRPEWDLVAIDFGEGDVAGSAERARRLLERAEHDGDDSSLPFVLAPHSGDLLRDGADAARACLDRALRLAEVSGQRIARVHVLSARARVEARLGEVEAARATADEAFELMEETGWRIGEWLLRADLAAMELSRSDPGAALAIVAGAVEPSGDDESDRWQWGSALAAEVLVALGRLDEARRVLDRRLRFARRRSSRRLIAEALRVRARLEVAAGDVEQAAASVAEAEAAHREMGDRWELARTLLVAGEIHRRSRRRARARAALGEAVALFEAMGARRWAELAREQLGRIGAGRADGGLTPTQREIAALVVTGLTNREVATRLFMSPHTVEAHLSAVYRSLGIRTRVELDAALRRHAEEPRDSGTAPRDSAPIATLEN